MISNSNKNVHYPDRYQKAGTPINNNSGKSEAPSKTRGPVLYEVTATGFPSGESNMLGGFAYFKKQGDFYSVVSVLSSIVDVVQVYGNTTGCWQTSLVVPELEDYFLVFYPFSGVTVTEVSGKIESEPVRASGGPLGYIVTGDFKVTLSGE